jgi:hypothetical protein
MNKEYYSGTESETAKVILGVVLFLFSIVFIVVMHFVIFYKGWGLSVVSWPWLIFLWIMAGIVNMVKDWAHKAVKKIL